MYKTIKSQNKAKI